MTRSQVRAFVEGSSVAFLLDLRDHEAFFRGLADTKLQK